MKKYPLVHVRWVDAFENALWFTEKEMHEWHKTNDWICDDVGWLIEKNKSYIVLASRKNDSEENFGSLHKIPRGWCKITYLKKAG